MFSSQIDEHLIKGRCQVEEGICQYLESVAA